MWSLFRENPRLITFGFLTAFFSGPGQSFLVSFFFPGIREDLGLSLSQMGDIYFLATLGGAIALPFLGRLLDQADLTRFTLSMALCLALGCIIAGLAQTIWVLAIGFLLLRCFGQGAMSMISSTTISKIFTHDRGKALSLSGQGYPIGEAILPLLVAAWIADYGWRTSFHLVSATILIVFIPAILYLLGHTRLRRRLSLTRREARGTKKGPAFWVLKDYRFYFAILSTLCLPAVLTGLFLYQSQISALKMWDAKVMATGFVFFAVTRSISGLMIGLLIDRMSATKLLGYVVLPMALGITILLHGESEYTAYLFLSFVGLSVGASGNVKPAYWAETYGVHALGSIKGVVALMMVIATAIAPPLFGRAFENNLPLDKILSICLVFTLVGAISGFICRFGSKKNFEKGVPHS